MISAENLHVKIHVVDGLGELNADAPDRAILPSLLADKIFQRVAANLPLLEDDPNGTPRAERVARAKKTKVLEVIAELVRYHQLRETDTGNVWYDPESPPKIDRVDGKKGPYRPGQDAARGTLQKAGGKLEDIHRVLDLVSDDDEAVDAELEASMNRHGYLEAFPVLVTGEGEHRQVVDGRHRERVARKLGLQIRETVLRDMSDVMINDIAVQANLARRQVDRGKVVKRLAQAGWDFDAVMEALDLLDPSDVKHVLKLPPKHERRQVAGWLRSRGWSQEKIAAALGTTHGTISKDLAHVVPWNNVDTRNHDVTDSSQNVITDSRGRLNAGGRSTPAEVQQAVAVDVLDNDMSQKDAAAKHNLSRSTVSKLVNVARENRARQLESEQSSEQVEPPQAAPSSSDQELSCTRCCPVHCL